MNYVPLHLHDFFSLLDGADEPLTYVARAKELGIESLSQTNHGTLSGHRDFYKACTDNGVKPILGLEAYISPTDRFDRRSKAARSDGTSVYNHITLLSTGQTGLDNLNIISEKAWTEGYYHKPRTDIDLLAGYSDGIVALSGCMNGLVADRILAGDIDGAEKFALQLKEIYGDRFFIEVQSHNPPELNHALLDLGDRLGIQPAMASDCHYANPEDLWIEEALLILSTNPNKAKDVDLSKTEKMDILEKFNYLYPDRKMSFQEIELYMRSYDDERTAFQAQGIDRTDIYENTVLISDMVEDYYMPRGLDLLPKPKSDPNARLRTLTYSGLKKRGLTDKQNYIDRVEHELGIIQDKGFSTYFLILADMINWGRKQDIMFGPGRGSAAGSLVLYSLGITAVDPIKYDLLFARFLNEERNDMPDIDQDISDTRRSEVKDYLTRKFKNVASISTFNYFKDKGVIRDAARTLSVPLNDVNKVLKSIETFEDFESSNDVRWFKDAYPEVLTVARALRGRIRGAGMHAAGLVIANEPINKYAPIETRSDPSNKVSGRIPVVAYDMDTAADIGLIKFDLLGLKTLSVIDDTVKSIESRHGKKIILEDIDLDDPVVLGNLSNGFTKGVFQAEAAPFTGLLKKMGVSKFDHVVAANALVRPGAMNSIGPDYIARKQGRGSIPRIHPIYDEITKDTYGAVLYQEQVMLLCNKLAGMSWADADRIRKIIGKKKDVKEFDEFKEKFVSGASEHVNKEFAEKLWHDFEAHANYSFNKCAYYGTKVQMADGTVETMSSIANMIESGEDVYVMSMWSDGKIKPHKVKSVARTGRKKLFKIKTASNRVMHITEDHRLLTNDGYKPLKDINIGDELIVSDKWVSERQRSARSENMRTLRRSDIGRKTDERASKRMKEYQSTLTFEDRSIHQRMISATTDRNSKVLPKLHAGWKRAWNDEEWRTKFIAKTLAAPRGYSTGSGYGNSGFAKDGVTWCASTPERELADWLIDLEVEFEAHKVLPSGRMCDFYVDGLYIEMDGMDRTYSYFENKYGDDLPFIVVTPEDYKEVLSSVFKVMHVRNGDPVVLIEESGYNNKNNYTMDIEMESDGPKNFVTIDGIVSHNSHSVAYSMLTMWTAWLKHHYPLEFMAALLKHEDDKNVKTEYLIEAKRIGVEVLLPHINKSELEFSIDKNSLRFGLTDIKYISSKVGNAIVRLRPYESYADLINKADQKGSGINSRAIAAMRNIGATTFDDCRPTGNERDYLWEYLGIPNFNNDLPEYINQDNIEDFDQNGEFVFVGLVTSIKRGSGWSRVEMVDETGSVGIFHNENTQIVAGARYLFLVSNNRIVRYISIDDIENMQDDILLYWMKKKTLNIQDSESVVIALSPRKTKAGKMMANAILSNKDKKLQSILIFPKNYPMAISKMKPGSVVKIKTGKLDDGSKFMKEVEKVER